jgi:hypothetical protein
MNLTIIFYIFEKKSSEFFVIFGIFSFFSISEFLISLKDISRYFKFEYSFILSGMDFKPILYK